MHIQLSSYRFATFFYRRYNMRDGGMPAVRFILPNSPEISPAVLQSAITPVMLHPVCTVAMETAGLDWAGDHLGTFPGRPPWSQRRERERAVKSSSDYAVGCAIRIAERGSSAFICVFHHRCLTHSPSKSKIPAIYKKVLLARSLRRIKTARTWRNLPNRVDT